jgi:hypothetical protein
MNGPYVAPLLQRTLWAVYRFYDRFFDPTDDRTPPVTAPLEVSIPDLCWSAFRADDFTYRFSTLTQTPTFPKPLYDVQVVAPDGDYVNLESIKLPLPKIVSKPPTWDNFLSLVPLWPAVAVRPPIGETAVRGHIKSGTAQPVADLTVEIRPGAAPSPPPGTPYTRSNANGDFLWRFPLLKGASGQTVTIGIQLNGGAIAVAPNSLSIELGRTNVVLFHRT